MPETKEAAKSATGDVKTAVNTAKGAVEAAQTIKTVAQVAATAGEASNPAGWAMLALKFKPYIDKIRSQAKKIAVGAGALAAYLFYLMWLKFLGALSGFAFGIISGIPLLMIPGAGPFLYVGWVSFWTVRGFMHPTQMIHLATHPWEAVTTPLSKAWHYTISSIKGSSTTVAGSISTGATSAAGSIGSAITGAASAVWGFGTSLIGGAVSGLGTAIGSLWGAITGGISISAATVAIPVLGSIGAITVGALMLQSNYSASFMSNQTDVVSKPQIPGQSQYLSIVKTANPTNIANSSLPTDVNFKVTLTVHASTLTNVTCTDTTILIKSDGSKQPLTTDLVGPICPSTLNPNQVLNFSFSTHADNTPDFQNSTIENTFTANFDVAGGTSGSQSPGPLPNGTCGAGSGFSALLPAPIPQSVGAVSPSLLPVNPDIVQAAGTAAQKTGVACELLIGVDFREAGWDANSSFGTGATLGTPELNPIPASDCTANGGTISGNSCIFNDLTSSANFAASTVESKMALLTGNYGPPRSFNDMIGAMSYYNGGGNANCGAGVPYNAPCPPPIGIDDPYSVAHFDNDHASMYLLYCANFTRCSPPQLFGGDGAATAAKEYYLSAGGN